jgi:RNA polymerase sigma-70 factor (ECF subfamily)
MDELSSPQLSRLLNRIADHDDKAIEQLYRHYHRPLYAFVRHLIRVEEAAEDIVHDTFLAVRKNPLGYDGSCKFFTWLCAIAKNKALDYQRKTQRRERLPLEEWNETLAETTADLSWDVLGHIEGVELNEVMLGCIDRLPLTQREAVYWVYYQDAKLEEVAILQDSPVNTIKTRLLQARLKLRDCLEQVYDRVELRRGS